MIDVCVTSDHHLYHANIIKYCDRPFMDVDEMHEHFIKAWNEVVKPDDIVINMGDYICGGNFEQIEEITRQLNGYKILITGNHDRKGVSWFKRVGIDRVFKHRWVVGPYCFSHRPQDKDYLNERELLYNYHGHSHTTDYGFPYINVGVDLNVYKPLRVGLNGITREDLMESEGSHTGKDRILSEETKERDRLRSMGLL